MKRRKQLIQLIFLILAPVLFAQEITIINHSFEDNSEGKPLNWEGDLWDKNEEAYYQQVASGGAYDGNNYLVLENRNKNHTMASTTVSVEPGFYIFSAMVKSENISDVTIGAHLGVEGYWGSSESLNGTITDWTELKLSIKVNPGVDSLKLMLQLGGFAALNTGKAYYDQVRLIKTTSLPEGIPSMEVPPPDAQVTESAPQDSVSKEQTPSLPPPKKGFWLIILLVVVAAGVPISILVLRRKDRNQSSEQG